MTGTKKILLLITKSNQGGAQRYVLQLASLLIARNYDVVVGYGGDGTMALELKKRGIRTISIGALCRDVAILKDFEVYRQLLAIVKSEQPDIVHLNSAKIGFIGALACFSANRFFARTSKVKVVFTAHGWAFNDRKLLRSKILFVGLQVITAWLVHKVIAVSQTTAEDLTKYKVIPKSRLTVIYNGIGKIELLKQSTARNILLEREQRKIWIGTVAELHPNKGIIPAICALKEYLLEDEEKIYLIIGTGEQQPKIEKYIECNDLQNKVILVGEIQYARKFLKAFDVLLIPSLTEACPYVLLEAGKAELPVVAREVGGIPELIQSECNGLLFREDSEIVSKVRTTLSEHQISERYAMYWKKRVEEEFNEIVMIEKTTKVYQECCTGKYHN